MQQTGSSSEVKRGGEAFHWIHPIGLNSLLSFIRKQQPVEGGLVIKAHISIQIQQILDTPRKPNTCHVFYMLHLEAFSIINVFLNTSEGN